MSYAAIVEGFKEELATRPSAVVEGFQDETRAPAAAITRAPSPSLTNLWVGIAECEDDVAGDLPGKMVRKGEYRGVHSGNTLRAFNSRYSRRYQTQSCIVSRVHPALLAQLAAGGKDVDKVKDAAQAPANVAVDVALSLNKQERWLLPQALARQIARDDFAQPALTVSLLTRHKLKRPASCVSYHTNRGPVRRIQPRNGRYFGFSYRGADGKSRRAFRREKRERMEEFLRRRRADLNGKGPQGKTVEVYTELGRPKPDTGITEDEVRYEVYLPSPAKSSLSHNPKYIRTSAQDQDGHAAHGKPRKAHRAKQRRRLALSDLDDCDLPAFHNNFHDEEEEEQCENTCTDDIATDEERNAHGGDDCLLGALMDKAERLQRHLAGVARPSRRRKTSGKGKDSGPNDCFNKTHIIYLPKDDDNKDNETEEHDVVPTAMPDETPEDPPQEPTRVVLSGDEVTAGSLRESFGAAYQEATCRPRKFLLDVTTAVRDMLGKLGVGPRVAALTPRALSFLVFTHDGLYDDGHDVYKVAFTSRLNPHQGPLPLPLPGDQELCQATVLGLVSSAVDFAQGFAVEMQEQKLFPINYIDSADIKGKQTKRELQQHLGVAEAYLPCLEHVFHAESSSLDDPAPFSLDEMLQEEPAFCDVCYDDVSPLTQGSATATGLVGCGHRVCDACWVRHVRARLGQGLVRVTCPGYDCQREVDARVLLTLAPLDVVEALLSRQDEVRIGASATEKWCPNPDCGRVLKLRDHPQTDACNNTNDTSPQHTQQDVVCACGTHVCFACLGPAHWPASCSQAHDYRLVLASGRAFPDRLAEVHEDSDVALAARLRQEQEDRKVMVVEGKHCPKCKNFVFKNGGCPQMTCRCGQTFCWFCGKPSNYSHVYRGAGCASEEEERKMTTTVVVRHMDYGAREKQRDAEEAERQRRQNTARAARQRVSLLERAAEHRQQRRSDSCRAKTVAAVARVVAAAAAKDRAVAEHVVHVCLTTFPLQDSESTTARQATPSVMDLVKDFLKRVVRSQRELHEVNEYSLVLLRHLPDSLGRRRALRIAEDLGAFCSFTRSVLEAWDSRAAAPGGLAGRGQDAVKALTRLAEIQGWVRSALASHLTTFRRLRATSLGAKQ